MASLEVAREFGGVVDHIRAYKVVVDGAVVGRLRPGEAHIFEVAPGRHELFMKLDWARSEKIEVELAAGDTARFQCAPRANMITIFYWTFIGWRRYISLTQVFDRRPGQEAQGSSE